MRLPLRPRKPAEAADDERGKGFDVRSDEQILPFSGGQAGTSLQAFRIEACREVSRGNQSWRRRRGLSGHASNGSALYGKT